MRRFELRHTQSMTEFRQSQKDDRALNSSAILVWVGIAAGVVFIVAVVFFSGFFFGRHAGGGFHHRDGAPYPGMMYPGERGQYGPMGPGMMDPDEPWPPGRQAPTTAPSGAPTP